MKDILLVDTMKINKYFEQTSYGKVDKDSLIAKANSGMSKYTKLEILNYLVSYLHVSLVERKALTNNRLNKYIIIINELIGEFNDNKINVDEDIIIKAKSLEELYINNRSLTGKEGDATLVEHLESLKELLNKNEIIEQLEEEKEEVTIVEEEQPEEKTKEEYESIIERLKYKVSSLESEIYRYEDAMSRSARQILENEKTISKKNQKIEEQKKDIRSIKNESNQAIIREQESQSKIAKLTDKIDRLNRTIDDYALRICELNKYITEVSKTNTTSETIVDNFILNQLFNGKVTLDNLLRLLDNNGFYLTKEDVIASLKRINNIINIKPTIGLEKKYGITRPTVPTNQILNYTVNNQKLDILFLADYHYSGTHSSLYIKEKLDEVYNYCAKYNIKNIFSLGDLIDNKNLPSEISKESFESVKQFIKDFESILPYDDDIKHFVLGGNHDKEFLRYGIDPIEEITFDREDVIPLGYSDAYIFFGKSDIVGLHHEGVPRENTVPDFLASGKEVKAYLEKAYLNANLNINERYLDLFGHFHKGRLDSYNSYGIVPSISSDRNNDGVWHLSFDIDRNGKINYVIVKNLVFDKTKELKASNESIYQKIRKQTN